MICYFPHRDLSLPEEEEVDLARHVAGLLHVDEVLEELFDGGDHAHFLETVAVARLLRLILHGSLEVPEFPIGLQSMRAHWGQNLLGLMGR